MHAKLKGILSTPIQATICNDQTKRHCLTKLHVQPVKDPPFTLASPVQWRSNYQIQSMSISWQALCHSTWLSLEKVQKVLKFPDHFKSDCLFDLGFRPKVNHAYTKEVPLIPKYNKYRKTIFRELYSSHYFMIHKCS